MTSVGSFNKTAQSGQVSATTITLGNSVQEYGKLENNTIAKNEVQDTIDFDLTVEENNNKQNRLNEIRETVNKVWNSGFIKVCNTYTSFLLSANDGTFKLTERIGDGLLWTSKTLGRAYAKPVGKVISWFNPEAAEKWNNLNDQAADLLKDIIGYEWRNGIRNGIKDSKFGEIINSNTGLEYGGEKSIKIADGSEKIQKIVGQALSSKVWGGWLAFALGANYGSGERAEKLYQENKDTTKLQEGSVLLTGVLTGLSWKSTGALTAKSAGIVKDIFSEGGKDVLVGIGKEIATKEFWKEGAKNALSVVKDGKFNLNAVMNYVSSAMSTGEYVTPYINGEKEFNGTEAMKIGAQYIKYLGLNVVEDTFQDYIMDFNSNKFTNGIEEVTDNVASNTLNSPSSAIGMPKKELTYQEWSYEIETSPYSVTIDGITFASKTEGGLKGLVGYYQNLKNNANINEEYFIDYLANKNLRITDIPMSPDDGSFNYGNIVYFSTSAIDTKSPFVFFHECGHFIDGHSGDRERKIFEDIIKQIKNTNNYDLEYNIRVLSNDYYNEYRNIQAKLGIMEPQLRENITNRLSDEIDNWKWLTEDKKNRLVQEELNKEFNYLTNKMMEDTGYVAISDILDAVSDGRVRDVYGLIGHGTEYYNSYDTLRYKEFLANISSLYNSDKMDLLNKYLPDFVKPASNRYFEELIEVNELERIMSGSKMLQDSKYGNGSFDFSLLAYLNDRNKNRFTRMDDIREYVTSLDDSAIKKYLTLPSTRNRILEGMKNAIDGINGAGYFENSIRNYLKTDNINYFTRNNGVRDYISMLGKVNIKDYLKVLGGK